MGNYLFVVCQVGAENALKAELAREWPAFRLSYSRPGFVTFKLPDEGLPAGDFDLRSTFARTYGISLGRLAGDNASVLAPEVWKLAGDRPYVHLHVWQRDIRLPGERGFEPGVTPLADEIGSAILAARPVQTGRHPPALNRRARAGDCVLDCLLVEPGEWLVGYHLAASVPSRYPGGSVRAESAQRRDQQSLLENGRGVELVAAAGREGGPLRRDRDAPGGAAQALLAAGLQVSGIDPAEMDERLLEHPRFTHIRKRAADMKRREFQGIRWLFADSNVAPERTLDTLEAIVTHREVQVRGLLVTLKLADLELAERIPEYVARIRSWGYRYVRSRQLAFNRHEVCVAALRERSQRRTPPSSSATCRSPRDRAEDTDAVGSERRPPAPCPRSEQEPDLND